MLAVGCIWNLFYAYYHYIIAWQGIVFQVVTFYIFWWKPNEWLIFVTNREKLQRQSIEAIVLPDRTHLDYYCHCILIFFLSLCLFLSHNLQVHTMHVPWNCHFSVSFKGCNVYGWINESVISGCHTYIHTYLPTYVHCMGPQVHHKDNRMWNKS